MPLPSALDFSSNIRKHATILGVIFTLDTIATLVLGVSWDYIPVAEEHAESFKNIKYVLLYSSVLSLIFTIVYWVGFLKRVRLCITFCLVYVVLAVVLQIIGLLGAIIELNITSTIVMLIVLAVNAYVCLVLVQLRKMMLNSSLTPYRNSENV